MESKFEWNGETIAHYALQSSYDSKDKVLEDVTSFVQNELALEDGETEEMLVEDLMNAIYEHIELYGVTINIEDLKIGSQLITNYDSQVEVVEIRKEQLLKPLVVLHKGQTQYFHFDQIKEIL
tara:strand:- start:668 stop:1036 length:369 start_codon:yes stop_codon:yes gene_type:complete